MSVFNNVLRPIIGPSSSHTYAPLRVGYYAHRVYREKFGEPHGHVKVRVSFLGHSAGACRGHESYRAIVGGLLGICPYDKEALKRIRDVRIDGEKVEVNGERAENISFRYIEDPRRTYFSDVKGRRIRGLGIELTMEDERGKKLTVEAESIGGGNVDIIDVDPKPVLPNLEFVPVRGRVRKYGFKKLEELEELARKEGSVHAVVIEREAELLLEGEEEVMDLMRDNWGIMMASIQMGLRGGFRGLLTGDEAIRLQRFIDEGRCLNKLLVNVAKYAMAVMAVNVSMGGLIVSAPTAGSSGILPAVLKAVYDEMIDHGEQISEDDVVRSLFTAGGIGLVFSNRGLTSASSHGCQAECGTSSAMAAAAITELRGGSPEQVMNASALALKNSLGLVCDPVCGLVEVPCVKRNAVYATVALLAAEMSLAGIKSVIPADEVIDAMDEVGRNMKRMYKENSRGGLANTETGERLMGKLRGRPRFRVPVEVVGHR